MDRDRPCVAKVSEELGASPNIPPWGSPMQEPGRGPHRGVRMGIRKVILVLWLLFHIEPDMRNTVEEQTFSELSTRFWKASEMMKR